MTEIWTSYTMGDSEREAFTAGFIYAGGDENKIPGWDWVESFVACRRQPIDPQAAEIKCGLIGEVLSACPYGLSLDTLLRILDEQGHDRDSATIAIRRGLDRGIVQLGRGLKLELCK